MHGIEEDVKKVELTMCIQIQYCQLVELTLNRTIYPSIILAGRNEIQAMGIDCPLCTCQTHMAASPDFQLSITRVLSSGENYIHICFENLLVGSFEDETCNQNIQKRFEFNQRKPHADARLQGSIIKPRTK